MGRVAYAFTPSGALGYPRERALRESNADERREIAGEVQQELTADCRRALGWWDSGPMAMGQRIHVSMRGRQVRTMRSPGAFVDPARGLTRILRTPGRRDLPGVLAF
jgi:hypothetical protein